ncbi:hypothetical protein RFI_34394, partial [Reticulomyxa filosa]
DWQLHIMKRTIACNFMQFECHSYRFLCGNDFILFFGGEDDYHFTSKDINQYSVIEDKWMKYGQTLPILLINCVIVLSEGGRFIHILGVLEDNSTTQIHMRTNVNKWAKEKQQWIVEDKEIVDLEKNNIEFQEMKQELDVKKLK